MRYLMILVLAVSFGAVAGEAERVRDPLQAEWQHLKLIWTHRRGTMTEAEQQAHRKRMDFVLAELRRRAALRPISTRN